RRGSWGRAKHEHDTDQREHGEKDVLADDPPPRVDVVSREGLYRAAVLGGQRPLFAPAHGIHPAPLLRPTTLALLGGRGLLVGRRCRVRLPPAPFDLAALRRGATLADLPDCLA